MISSASIEEFFVGSPVRRSSYRKTLSPVCISDLYSLDNSLNSKRMHIIPCENSDSSSPQQVFLKRRGQRRRRQIFPGFSPSGHLLPCLKPKNEATSLNRSTPYMSSDEPFFNNCDVYCVSRSSQEISDSGAKCVNENVPSRKYLDELRIPDKSTYEFDNRLVGRHRLLPKSFESFSSLSDVFNTAEVDEQNEEIYTSRVLTENAHLSSDVPNNESTNVSTLFDTSEKNLISVEGLRPNNGDDSECEIWGHFDERALEKSTQVVRRKELSKKKHFSLDIIYEE